MKKGVGRVFHWAARVLAILVIVFLAMFSLDVFEEGFSLLELGGFFIHSIPSIFLLGALFVAWKREKVGGIIFLVLWFLFMVFLTVPRSLFVGKLTVESVVFILPSPLFVVGILFLLSWYYKNKK
ncbi:MAG: hypothetical protein ABIH63_00620 [archaeon]